MEISFEQYPQNNNNNNKQTSKKPVEDQPHSKNRKLYLS